MKKTSMKAVMLCTVLFMGSAVLCAADAGIIRNPEFKLNAKGKLDGWYTSNSPLMEALVQKPEGNYIKLPCVEKNVKNEKRFGNVFTQHIRKPAAGTYVYGMDVSPSRQFYQVLIVMYYKGQDGKTVFNGTHLKPKDYPEPGKWTRIVGEITIPEGVNMFAFCLEIRAKEAGGDVLIKAPSMKLKEE